MTVPFFDIREQNKVVEAELLETFARVLKSGQFILGPEVARFEEACAEFLGVRHALGVSSGTDAILLALMALGIGPGDEVICPSFTFFATAGCVSRVGATPVFVDSFHACFNINFEDVASRITPRTKAIIPVHLYGQSADMDALMKLANGRGIAVIEDAAQAFGAQYKGRACGTIGQFGTYSFFPTKNLGGLGDGGLIVTNDDELAEKARILRMHGMEPKYYHQQIGGNFRIDALQAALLNVKLPHLPAYTAARRRTAVYYTEQLSSLPGVAKSKGDDAKMSAGNAKLILPFAPEPGEHIWNQYTIRLTKDGDRDRLREHLSVRGIGSEIYYPVPLHRQECYRELKSGSIPGAELLAKQVLSLPVYPELSSEGRNAVVDAIRGFLQST